MEANKVAEAEEDDGGITMASEMFDLMLMHHNRLVENQFDMYTFKSLLVHP
jgi:hypothetical protein